MKLIPRKNSTRNYLALALGSWASWYSFSVGAPWTSAGIGHLPARTHWAVLRMTSQVFPHCIALEATPSMVIPFTLFLDSHHGFASHPTVSSVLLVAGLKNLMSSRPQTSPVDLFTNNTLSSLSCLTRKSASTWYTFGSRRVVTGRRM